MELKINRDAFEKLDAQLRDIRTRLGEGLRGRELLATIYLENMPDKNERQAEQMAGEAMEGVEAFYRDLDRAREDKDAYIDASLAALLKGKSLRERCEALKTVLDTLIAMHSENLNPQERQALGEEKAVELPDEVTAQTEAELTLMVKDLISSYTFMAPLLPESADILSALAAGGEGETLLNAGREQMDYLAALSMLAYVNIKNGMFPEAPEEISLKETATLVCAASETVRAAAESEEGWTETGLYLLLSAIGVVVAVSLATTVLVDAIAAVALPVGIWGALCSFFLYYCGFKAFEKALTWWAEDAEKLAAVAVRGGRTLLDGLKTLAAFARDNLLPAGRAALKAGWERIRAWLPLSAQGETLHAEEETVETEPGAAQTVPDPVT